LNYTRLGLQRAPILAQIGRKSNAL